ncbi:hypothetical protein H4582DRAFT_2051711 [Lactarius indigo]|nr:hypothetical protein H4582DRAFT_2051711 [Lactarius indigo]
MPSAPPSTMFSKKEAQEGPTWLAQAPRDVTQPVAQLISGRSLQRCCNGSRESQLNLPLSTTERYRPRGTHLFPFGHYFRSNVEIRDPAEVERLESVDKGSMIKAWVAVPTAKCRFYEINKEMACEEERVHQRIDGYVEKIPQLIIMEEWGVRLRRWQARDATNGGEVVRRPRRMGGTGGGVPGRPGLGGGDRGRDRERGVTCRGRNASFPSGTKVVSIQP